MHLFVAMKSYLYFIMIWLKGCKTLMQYRQYVGSVVHGQRLKHFLSKNNI